MPIEEVSTENVICTRCGTKFARRKGYFPVTYGEMYQGNGYLHICRDCLDKTYSKYLGECGDVKTAVRQTCRKLDIYWSEPIYDAVMKRASTRSIISQYLQKLNSAQCVGKSYDDTLLEEGSFWTFGITKANIIDSTEDADPENTFELTKDIVAFWGRGYSHTMYSDLEQRRLYYMSKFPAGTVLDIGSEALLRQICVLEVNIAKDSMDGKSTDKYANTLNTLLGSLNLKPVQNKESDAGLENVPMGVWLYKFENKRPLPETSDDCKDANRIKKYVFTWMGHLCKMMGKKNAYSKLYEDEINRLRVEMPQYDIEDDEEFMMEVMEDSAES